MVYNDLESFELLTDNARDWYDYFNNLQAEYSDDDFYAVALSKTRDLILQILLDNLDIAINNAGEEDNEFQRPLLREKLFQVFNNYDIIQVAGGSVYFDAETIAGDWDDFWDGIALARSIVSSGKVRTPEQRANYWRLIVYPSYSEQSGIDTTTFGDYEEEDEDKWSQTIAIRQNAWQDKAPYWLILEHGNTNSAGAYPHNSATNFIYKSTMEAQSIFEQAMGQVNIQASNLIDNAMNEFSNYPETYNSYDVLGDFFAEGSQYYIYITSTRRVGVALPETFRELRRQYK